MTHGRTKVLIVDDEPDILLMMRVNLEGEGFDTVLAADGETAVERVRNEAPAVVLLDVMMPVLDGWGVLEVLANDEVRPAIIVVSAKAAPADLARAYQLGAADYVTKPFSIEHLVSVIRDVLGRSEDEMEQRRQAALSELGVTGPTS
ncbi:MAG TPA: response regulator transcription factor [Acidimicrobiia bacterium]|nr:response regulator transcription factor [Acidimicrobiia bacterium]